MFERAIANLGDCRAMAITLPDKKIDKPVERSGLPLPPGFKNSIGKEIQFRREEQRNFYRGVTNMSEATDRRTARS